MSRSKSKNQNIARCHDEYPGADSPKSFHQLRMEEPACRQAIAARFAARWGGGLCRLRKDLRRRLAAGAHQRGVGVVQHPRAPVVCRLGAVLLCLARMGERVSFAEADHRLRLGWHGLAGFTARQVVFEFLALRNRLSSTLPLIGGGAKDCDISARTPKHLAATACGNSGAGAETATDRAE